MCLESFSPSMHSKEGLKTDLKDAFSSRQQKGPNRPQKCQNEKWPKGHLSSRPGKAAEILQFFCITK